MQKNLSCYAVVAPGLEGVCSAELRALGITPGAAENGGIPFVATLRELYLTNLHLRCASRILVRVGEVAARDFPDLYRKCVRLPWGSFVRPGTAVQVRASSRQSRLVHSGRVAETVTAAIGRALGDVPGGTGEEQLVLARFVDDRCLLSLDSSGAHLHRRGYRRNGGAAPLRETLAAGLLHLAGWHGDVPLADPLCGSGTIAIEAALLASGIAPGRARDFSFMHWPGYRAGLWQVLCGEADQGRRTVAGPLLASDHDPAVLATARENAGRASVAEVIDFAACALADLPVRTGGGLILCNPPYGARLGHDAELPGFYRALGSACRRAFPGWRLAILAPDERLAQATGWSLRRIAAIDNGGIPLGFYLSPRE